MEITFENLSSFAYNNAKIVQKPIRGIVVEFRGLGSCTMIGDDSARSRGYASRGILHVIPYYDPWCWMNDRAIAFVDRCLDVLFVHYELPEDTPIVSYGGSMGGQGTLVYTRYAKRTPVACIANAPVCDMPFHATERPDLPRSFYAAYGDAPDFDAALLAHSPLHLAASMPDIPYHLFHTTWDTAVNIGKHTDRLYAALKENHRVTYDVIEHRGHCDIGAEGWKKLEAYVKDAIGY